MATDKCIAERKYNEAVTSVKEGSLTFTALAVCQLSDDVNRWTTLLPGTFRTAMSAWLIHSASVQCTMTIAGVQLPSGPSGPSGQPTADVQQPTEPPTATVEEPGALAAGTSAPAARAAAAAAATEAAAAAGAAADAQAAEAAAISAAEAAASIAASTAETAALGMFSPCPPQGMSNLHSTCFANAVIQALLATGPKTDDGLRRMLLTLRDDPNEHLRQILLHEDVEKDLYPMQINVHEDAMKFFYKLATMHSDKFDCMQYKQQIVMKCCSRRTSFFQNGSNYGTTGDVEERQCSKLSTCCSSAFHLQNQYAKPINIVTTV